MLNIIKKNILNTVGALLLVGIVAGCSGGTKKQKIVYEDNWESIEQYQIPEWFSDAKFGIFIHWGPYSVPAYKSEWYPRFMYQDSIQWHQTDPSLSKEGPSSFYTHHVETYGHPGEFGYKDFIPMFKAEKFDANEWIQLFKKAGAKYVVPVAEHHDGFAMYNSNITKWNSVNMGPKRDVVGELSAAAKEQGLYFGVSSHYAFNWDYFYHKPGFDTYDPEYVDLYGPIHEPFETVSDEFLEVWWNRTTDLIDSYEPDILWFDFYIDREEFIPYHPKIAAYYYNKGEQWEKEVILQTKNMNLESFPEGSNILDIERGKLADIRKFPWQTDTSVGEGSWCHTEQWTSKSAKTLIDDLIDIVSKNGTMLLNVGPMADGSIPEEQKQVLLDIGAWLDINGEGIYNTRPWTQFGEGPTVVHSGHHTEAKNEAFTSSDFRFTQKDNSVFVFALGHSEDGKYAVESLANSTESVMDIADVSLLGSNEKVEWNISQEGLSLKVNEQRGGEYPIVFKVTKK